MRIGIDVKLLSDPTLGGGQRYVRNLLRGLSRLRDSDDFDMFVYSDRPFEIEDEVRRRFTIRVPGFSNSAYSLLKRHTYLNMAFRHGLYEQILLPSYVKRDRVDILHSTQNSLPFAKNCKTILSVRFLTYILHRGPPLTIAPKLLSEFQSIIAPPTISRADAIITSGETIKNELCSHFKYERDRVWVIPPAIDQRFRMIGKDKAREIMSQKFNVESDFVLVMSGGAWGRTFVDVFQAFAMLWRKNAIPHNIVVVGSSLRVERDFLHEFIRKEQVQNRIIEIEYVDDMTSLYNAATLLTYPSPYEGFGVVPLEAMACGLPVVAISSAPPVKEMLAGAGTLVAPGAVDQLANVIYDLLTDSALRSKVIAKGVDVASKFNWKTIAEKTLGVYRSIQQG